MNTTTLHRELDRCLETLGGLTPGSDDYMSTIRCAQILCELGGSEPEPAAGAQRASRPVRPDEPAAPPEAKPDQTPETAPDAPGPTKEEVRAALADARLKGLNISGLIASVGAANLSGVTRPATLSCSAAWPPP